MRNENNIDNFDPNRNYTQQDRGTNPFFANRGGHTFSGPRPNFTHRSYNNNYQVPDFNNRNGRPHFYNSNYNNNEYRDQRPRPYYNNRNYGRDNYNNNYYNRGGYNTDRRYNNNPNFNREYNRENNYNNENEEEREAKLEKERILSEFRKKYSTIIEALKILFINESLKEEQIIDILQTIKSNPNLTIFEAMNSIYRQVQIIKTLSLDKSNRQYGPNQDILEFEFDKNLNKENLKEVIKKYKIYKSEEEIPDKENNEEEIEINFDSIKDKKEVYKKEKKDNMNKYWFYIDDFDKRRKLTKDEEGYFNYLPLMNPEGNQNSKDEDDIYAKNENEILYHALFYKTQMCKECNIDQDKKDLQLLCPYSHDILKDFRIIYKYTDEDVCKFMILLQSSNLFSFQNYLNYIPMSLSPKFNIDTFKVHKCQLDEEACPNDYHICPYYHKKAKVDEMRRPPSLFGYSGSTGDICFDSKKKVYCPEKCPCGIFCRFLHSKNEFNYHQDHFRKEFDCKRKKDRNNKCVFIRTCYGKHPENEYKEESEEEKEEEIEEEEIEKDEDIQDSEKKGKNALNVAKAFRCRKCQYIESVITYFKNCKHFMCLKCFKKLFKEKKKEGKNLECPFCGKEIDKDSVVQVKF